MPSVRTIVFVVLILAVLVYLWLSLQSDRQPNRSSHDVQTLTLYCAAGLKPPVEAIRGQYESEYGISLQINYEGSGTLLSKIKIAPQGDLFLAADDSYIALARTEGLVAEELPLATMQPVIAVGRGNPRQIAALTDLLADDIRLGLANPDAAAVGRITRQMLGQTGQWKQFFPRRKS